MENHRSTAVIALTAILALAFVAGAYFLLYDPAFAERKQLVEQAEAIEKTNVAAQKELDRLAQDAKRLDEMKEEVAQNRAKFPTGPDISTFTKYLQDLVEASGAKFVGIDHQPAVALTLAQALPPGPGGQAAPTVPQPPEGLYQYSFSIELKGDLAQTQAFVTALQADNARMFLITSISFRVAEPVDPGSDSKGSNSSSTGKDTSSYKIEGFTFALVPKDEVPPSSTVGSKDDK
ncbi:MAG: hypothetical protein LBJ02_05265 [Bifidobacteriaceae bacterium]|jgi:hypothetical protein|nr:hypothetical protein [Bifidobacteriaceae bacterium]